MVYLLQTFLSLLLLTVSAVQCSLPYVINEFKEAEIIRPKITPRGFDNALDLNIIGSDGKTLLTGLLGISSPLVVGAAVDCSPANGYDECYAYGDYAKLQVIFQADNCTRFEWSSNFATRLEDCFELFDGVHWYGGGETYLQTWPIEGQIRREAPLVTGDSLQGMEYGGVTENYWLVSTGVALYVDEDVPAFISWGSVHANKVCIVAKDEYPYFARDNLELKYDICTGTNLKEVHQRALRKYFNYPPPQTPDLTMILRPFWSTWAQYHAAINQSLVIEYAQRLISEGFNLNSHIEIDDNWETCYGEHVFNTQKFPNVTEMVETLKSLDFKVTLWIHPFINFECPSFQTALLNSYFVKDARSKTGITSWWQGKNSGIIDFSNPEAVTWWNGRLKALQTQYGIDSFKFDAGETNWLPYSSLLANSDKNLQPNLYTTKYVEALVPFGGMIEVRAGRGNQKEPIFTRMLDKDSRWGHDNGLRSLIPTLLHFGLIGYPFVLPDMIGGNAYHGRPSAELYVRWMQANAFMPAVQFSLVPWDYDAEVIQLTKEILALREEYQDLILKALSEVKHGAPINRPMWWEDPDDPATFTIDSQYMLGEDILVAPILYEGQTSRDIYLTRGEWVGNNGIFYTGPQNLTNYPAPINTLPFFIKNSTLVAREQKGQYI